MIWNETAHVVDPDEFRVYDWSEWQQFDPPPGGPMHPVGEVAAPRPRGHRPRPLRPLAVVLRHLQPPERLEARPSHLPVLRRPSQAGRAITIDHVIPRSRGGVSSWTNCVAACVPCKRPQGRPLARAGRHAPPQEADSPRLEASLLGAFPPSRELVPVPQRLAGLRDGLISSQSPTGASSWERTPAPTRTDRVRILAPLLFD